MWGRRVQGVVASENDTPSHLSSNSVAATDALNLVCCCDSVEIYGPSLMSCSLPEIAAAAVAAGHDVN